MWKRSETHTATEHQQNRGKKECGVFFSSSCMCDIWTVARSVECPIPLIMWDMMITELIILCINFEHWMEAATKRSESVCLWVCAHGNIISSVEVGCVCIYKIYGIDTHLHELLNWIVWPENRKSNACYDLNVGSLACLLICYSNENLYFELGARLLLCPLLLVLLLRLLFVVIESTLEGQ